MVDFEEKKRYNISSDAAYIQIKDCTEGKSYYDDDDDVVVMKAFADKKESPEEFKPCKELTQEVDEKTNRKKISSHNKPEQLFFPWGVMTEAKKRSRD